MGTRDLRLGSVLDGVAWLRSAVSAATSTPPGSPERQARLAELSEGIRRARFLIEARRGRFTPELRLAISAAELVVDRLRGDFAGASSPQTGAPSTGAPGEASGSPPDRAAARPRVHPRRRLLRG